MIYVSREISKVLLDAIKRAEIKVLELNDYFVHNNGILDIRDDDKFKR